MRDIIKNKNNDFQVAAIFNSIPGFKEWIERTQLFSTISRFAGTGLIIEGIPDILRLQLNGIPRVETAEDLPIELIQHFYNNSPFRINIEGTQTD